MASGVLGEAVAAVGETNANMAGAGNGEPANAGSVKSDVPPNGKDDNARGDRVDGGPGEQVMKCKIKHLESRYDDDDQIYFSEPQVKKPASQKVDRWSLFAICLVRRLNRDDEPRSSYLRVNSAPLRKLLADVIGDSYPREPIHDLSEIEWNSRCFEDLVLDLTVKKTVQALVSTHAQKRKHDGDGYGFDDIVKGKGLRLVCVLHGPPGVGKTLTAECVAEFVKRLLYMVSSGERMFLRGWPR